MPWKKIKEYVWVVRQTQPSDDYDQRTIAVYENREDAENIARKLNKVFGKGCDFTDEWDFIDVRDDYSCCHYYDIESIQLNPNPEDYLWETMEE